MAVELGMPGGEAVVVAWAVALAAAAAAAAPRAMPLRLSKDSCTL